MASVFMKLGHFANHIELDINKMNHRKDEVVDEIIGNVHHLLMKIM